MSQKITAVFLALCLALSLAACSSGGSGESSQAQAPSPAESTEAPQESAEPEESAAPSPAEENAETAEGPTESEASEETEEKPIKSIRDDLTEEDIQALKDAIGKAVLAEYCESNQIDPADFSWDVFTSSDGSGYHMWMNDLYGKIQESGEFTVQVDDERIERVTVEEGADETDKVTAAVCNGVLDYLNTQAPYNVGYYSSVSRVLADICDLVETIDLTALSD